MPDKPRPFVDEPQGTMRGEVQHRYTPKGLTILRAEAPGARQSTSVLVTLVLIIFCVVVGALMGARDGPYLAIPASVYYFVYLAACWLSQRRLRGLIREPRAATPAQAIAGLQRGPVTTMLRVAHHVRTGWSTRWLESEEVPFVYASSEEVSTKHVVRDGGHKLFVVEATMKVTPGDKRTTAALKAQFKSMRASAEGGSDGGDNGGRAQLGCVESLYAVVSTEQGALGPQLLSAQEEGAVPWYLGLRTYWVLTALLLNPLFVALFAARVKLISASLKRRIHLTATAHMVARVDSDASDVSSDTIDV